ncbi:VOC family protein [Patulibacter americanus]|uniref:VOC family protein n=1 Tax=Patulibacter americanus TaxID=588672 RepID=UPI0003B5DDC3|nr:VOC family protein [Patulibacter americanus]
MTDSPTVRLTAVGTVFVPVTDQERAIAFYVDVLGFELRVDAPYGGGHRWVEVAPPGSPVALALVPPTEGRAAASDRTLCALASADLDADHTALREHGVAIDAVVGRAGTSRPGLISPSIAVPDPAPPQCCFRDPDGNRFLLVGA